MLMKTNTLLFSKTAQDAFLPGARSLDRLAGGRIRICQLEVSHRRAPRRPIGGEATDLCAEAPGTCKRVGVLQGFQAALDADHASGAQRKVDFENDVWPAMVEAVTHVFSATLDG